MASQRALKRLPTQKEINELKQSTKHHCPGCGCAVRSRCFKDYHVDWCEKHMQIFVPGGSCVSCDKATFRDVAKTKQKRDKARIAVEKKRAEINAAQITAEGQTSKKSRKVQVDIEKMKKDLKLLIAQRDEADAAYQAIL